MGNPKCSKCGGEMDEGEPTKVGYMSKRQTGIIRVGLKMDKVYACLTCGYVEFYVKVEDLKKKSKR